MSETQENTSLQVRNTAGLQTQVITEISPDIMGLDKELVLNYKQAPKFKELDSNEIISRLTELIYKIYFELGDKNTPDIDKESIIASNIRDISRYFSYYSLKDIERCYEMGVRGEFAQKVQKFMGACNISVEILYSWLRDFKSHHGTIIRRQAQFESRKHEQLLLENKEEHRRIHQAFLQEIINTYNKFLSDSQYPMLFQRDFGNTIYNYFDKGKQIKLETSTKEKLIKQALRAHIEQYVGMKEKLSGKIQDIISKSPVMSAWVDHIDVEKNTAAENKAILDWLKQLPTSWRQWQNQVTTETHQKLVNQIFFMAQRLALRVVIYGWKKDKIKIEDIITKVEKS